MGLASMYCGSRRKKKEVQVIFPDGKPRHFHAPITIRDLLLQYPHHYCNCVPHVPGSTLSEDDELEGGNTYLLLPLPRLFPNNRPASNSRPCDKGNRAKTWEPSLQMIAENNTPLEPKTDQHSVNRQDKIFVKPAAVKPKYNKFSYSPWDTGRARGMSYLAPSAFIF